MAKTSQQLFTGDSAASQGFAAAVFVAAVALAAQALSLTWTGPPPFLVGWSRDVAAPLAVVVIALLGVSPLPLGQKVFLNLGSGAAFTVLLIFPASNALPVAFSGTLIAQLVRRLRGDRLTPFTIAFNQVQYVATWSLVAAVFVWTHNALGAREAMWVPIAASGLVYIAVNTWLVSTWIALRKRTWTLGLWLRRLREGGVGYGVSLALGGVVAGLIVVRPLLVVPLLVGVALLHWALSHMSRIQQRRAVARLAVLVETHERVSPYVSEHSERVAWWAERLAREMRVPEHEVELIGFAGKLHDLGLTLLRPELEAMPDALPDAQETLVLQHAAAGADAVARIPGMARVAQYVRGHHENHDGSGYPDGLRGEEIPLGARILRVVDAYDSLRSPRFHRLAYDETGALARLQVGAGTHYDPLLVRALQRLVETGDDRSPAAARAGVGAAASSRE
ncbi:MAG: HD-GYP domain-containing protein [bacterium]